MAAQTPKLLASIGSPLQRLCVYAVYGVTAADTVQTSTEFQRVTQANYYPATGSGTAGASMTVATNTNLTVPSGPAVDDGYVLAFGSGVSQ